MTIFLSPFIPCTATMAVMKRELGSWKWFGASIGMMLTLSLLGDLMAYRFALGVGW